MRNFMTIVEALSAPHNLLNEDAPVAPMKPGQEAMDRQSQQDKRQTNPSAPTPPPAQNNQQNNQNGQSNNNNQQGRPNPAAPNGQAAAAPTDTSGEDAEETVEDGIKAGDDAKKILKDAGVIESLIRESVDAMFATKL